MDLNPLDNIGGALAKGAAQSGLKELRAFLAEYPVIDGIAKGKRVEIDLAVNGGAPLTLAVQARVIT